MAYEAEGDRNEPAQRRIDAAIACVVFALAVLYFQRTLHLSFELRDEGFELFNIARAAAGEIPHRDFAVVYPPGVYLLCAPVYARFGERVLPIRELLLLFRAAAVVLSYLISRRFLPRSFALLASGFSLAYWGWLTWSLTTPYGALFTIPLCMGSLYLLMLALARERPLLFGSAGFVCGFALLFKWTLAVMTAYGAVLAIAGVAMLRPREEGAPRYQALMLVAWAAIALLVVLPFFSIMSPFDYLLHIGPIHAVMGVVAIRFARGGDGRAVLRRAIPPIFHYGLGFAVVPLVTLGTYAAWGHVGDLLYDTVVRPLGSDHYALPVAVPELRFLAVMGGVVALVTAGLAAMGRRWRVALAGALVTLVLAPFAIPEGGLSGIPEALGQSLFELPAITAYAAAGVLAWDLLRRSAAPEGAALVVPVLLFQTMMSFQIFPRAGYNITLMLGVLAPMVGFLTYRWSALANAKGNAILWTAAFGLSASLALVFIAARVDEVVASPRAGAAPERAFHHPALAGLQPSADIWQRDSLADFDALIEALASLEPTDAPLFVVPNLSMVYFLSDRPPLFPDRSVVFFLAGWNLLPRHDHERPSEAQLEARFDAHPETIVVTRAGDETSANLDAAFPELLPYLSRHFAPVASFGPYRILRRQTTRASAPSSTPVPVETSRPHS